MLEGSEGIGVETYDLMLNVKTSLQSRLEQEFYGSIARTAILKCDNDSLVITFKKESKTVLLTAISYLDKWFNFQDSVFKFLKPLNLKVTIPLYCDLDNIIKKFKIKNIDEDMLFEESIKLKKFSDQNENTRKICSNDKTWVKFFQQFPECQNLIQIVSYVFSIPHGNATSERIFSLMNVAWRKERQSLLIENLEAELMTKENFKMTCHEFRKFLQTEEGSVIIKKAMSSEKYK